MTGCTEDNADLDHASEWPQGPSCPANLSGLCRHHHRLKHSPGWTHTLREDGRTEWTSPTGTVVETFPSLWVHVGDECSPPGQGANADHESWEVSDDEQLAAFHAATLSPEAASILPPTQGTKVDYGEPPF